uniref:non-specific serine/threonine protein kinase n=1 Tax=Pyrodinium bahamense TaxID=73915 RepID=A0A7S0FZ75_9DINO
MASCGACLLLFIHFATFGAQLLALAAFWQTGNLMSFWTSLATLLFTGSFFADAVWRDVVWRPAGVQVLPIKRQPCCLRVLCSCPLLAVCGCLQGVMVPLTLEPICGDGPRSEVRSFHAKAVTGLFEGIICSAVLLYAHLGLRFPEGSSQPVTFDPPSYPLMVLGGIGPLLKVAGGISFLSGGLGILHLDHCLCLKLGAYISSGAHPHWRLFRHWLFRTSELVCRVTLHVFFLLLTAEFLPCWRWAPFVLSVASSICVIYIYGGNEANRPVRLLCGFLCTFVNIFRFVDSPYKQRAARELSRVLEWRHVLELVYMPCLAVFLFRQLIDDPNPSWSAVVAELAHVLQYLSWTNPVVLACTLVAFPLYYCLLTGMGRFLEAEKNIFAASAALDVEEVRRLALGSVRVDVNKMDSEGRTPLAEAVLRGVEDDKRCAVICGILCESGARVDLRAPKERVWLRRLFMRDAGLRWTPLHLAARRGSVEVLRALLQHVPEESAGPEAYTDLAGDTPLHVAVAFGREDAVRCLVGGFPEWAAVRNLCGKTPRDLARTPLLQRALDSPLLITESPCCRASTPAWHCEELTVTRVTGSRGLFRAPGLCSYVVGAAGGPVCGSVLKLVPEDAELEPPPPEGCRDSDSAPAPATQVWVEDLEPVDTRNREPCTAWAQRPAAAQGGVAQAVSFIKAKGFCQEAVLGQGAYGVVWLGRRRGGSADEVYAVKNIAMKSGTDKLVRRECDMSEKIRIVPHPCVVQLFGVQEFVDQSLCVTVMELLPNGDLLQPIVAARRRAAAAAKPYEAPAQTIPWLGQIFLALEHLHLKMRVLLRDLKPDNVCLDARNRAKIIDLGLGRIGTQSEGLFTLSGMPPGTPGYCPPEVLQELPYSEKADLYCFGVTAWVLLTGGLVSKETPKPPTGFTRSIRSCFSDCRLLHDCIDRPQEHDALPLAHADAYAFVKSLTALSPSGRPDHGAIRAHGFFTDHLQRPLPERSTGRAGVEHWLSELGF